MARHCREIKHVFEIVYQTLFLYSRNPKNPIGPFLNRFNASAPPAAWFCGNAHPLGWLDFAFVETPIPLDGLICILTNFLIETMMSIIEDGSEMDHKCPNHPKGTTEGPCAKHEGFCTFRPETGPSPRMGRIWLENWRGCPQGGG